MVSHLVDGEYAAAHHLRFGADKGREDKPGTIAQHQLLIDIEGLEGGREGREEMEGGREGGREEEAVVEKGKEGEGGEEGRENRQSEGRPGSAWFSRGWLRQEPSSAAGGC